MAKTKAPERINVTQTVDASIRYSSLNSAIAELMRIRRSIPRELREQASLDIEYKMGYYDSVEITTEVSYPRPETDAEMNERLERTRMFEMTQRQRDEAEFKRLAKKLGKE